MCRPPSWSLGPSTPPSACLPLIKPSQAASPCPLPAPPPLVLTASPCPLPAPPPLVLTAFPRPSLPPPRLPASIKAPHQRSGLSAAQYSMWLDTHSAEEVHAWPGEGGRAGGGTEKAPAWPTWTLSDVQGSPPTHTSIFTSHSFRPHSFPLFLRRSRCLSALRTHYPIRGPGALLSWMQRQPRC